MKYYEKTSYSQNYDQPLWKLGYIPKKEFVKTNNIDKFNKGKKIKFQETQEAKRLLCHLDKDVVYSTEVE